MSHAQAFLDQVAKVLSGLDTDALEAAAHRLARARDEGGRAFVLGVGGSAANASHLVNDLRKLADLDAATPSDNVAELTARTNDDGWAATYADWLRVSRLGPNDVVLVLSVGGGDAHRNVSPNLVAAVDLAVERGADVVAVVGRDGGHAGRHATHLVLVPTVDADAVTPLVEATQGVVCHLLVSHPALAHRPGAWESLSP